MRYKAVPPTPPSETDDDESPSETDDLDDPTDPVEILATVRDALPLVPRPEDDCCARLVDRVDWIDERDVATQWIVFLRALGLAEQSDAGYARVRGDVDQGAIAQRFRENILGAREVLDAIGDVEEPANAGDPTVEDPTTADHATEEPRTTQECFEAVEPVIPEWERRRNDVWREEWQTRTERLLAWASILGLAEERAEGYVRS